MDSYNKKTGTPLAQKNELWAMLVSLTFLSLIDALYNTLGLGKSTLFTLLWIVFVGIFFFASLQLIKDIKFESNYFKYLFYIFMAYGSVTVFRGISFSTDALTSYLRVPYIFWPFLLPLMAFLGSNLKTYGYLLQILFFIGCLFPIITLAFPILIASAKPAEVLIYATVLGSGYVLMNSNYISKVKINISFLFIVIALIVFLLLARRAGLFMLSGLIAASYIFIIFSSKKPLIFKLFPLFLAIGVVALVKFDTISKTLLDEINKRLYEDTRTTVVEMFYMDIENHLFFGKGMNATYYCPIGGGLGETGIDYDIVYYRDVIENGYLQLMLSGGVAHVALFLLIAVPASFNGIFRSSNLFAKSCGAMIVLWMVFMIGSGLPSLSLGYVLVWISIGVCFKKSVRSKSDEEIQAAFNNSLPIKKKKRTLQKYKQP